MSKEAEKLGADVLSIITPSFAVASQKELYDHYVEVAKHVDTQLFFTIFLPVQETSCFLRQ